MTVTVPTLKSDCPWQLHPDQPFAQHSQVQLRLLQPHCAGQGSEAGKLPVPSQRPVTARLAQSQCLSARHGRVSLQSPPSKGLNHPHCPKPKQDRGRRLLASNSPSSLPFLQLGTDEAWGQLKPPGAARETPHQEPE